MAAIGTPCSTIQPGKSRCWKEVGPPGGVAGEQLQVKRQVRDALRPLRPGDLALKRTGVFHEAKAVTAGPTEPLVEQVSELSRIPEDEGPGPQESDATGGGRDFDGLLRAEPGALAFGFAVEVGESSEHAQPDGGNDHASHRGVHVEQQFLQVQQVPGRFGWVRCDIRVRLVKQWGVNEEAQQEKGKSEEHGRDELDEHEVRPDEHFLVTCTRLRAGDWSSGASA